MTQQEPNFQIAGIVREALEARRGQWPELANAAGVSHSWISQFVRGKIPNPGVATLERLWLKLAANESHAGAANG